MYESDLKGNITAFPLQWPIGWKRTPGHQIKRSRYGDHSLAQARNEVSHQVRLMGGQNLVISSNLQLRTDGLPRSGQRQPADKGVAIYFQYRKKPMCFACDQWSAVEDNLWAIGKTIDAIRSIERAGSSDMMERAFTGYEALPAPAMSETWWNVLGVHPQDGLETVKAAYRQRAKETHPDAGGSADAFQRVQKAYEHALLVFDQEVPK